jgi:hypothetical protein
MNSFLLICGINLFLSLIVALYFANKGEGFLKMLLLSFFFSFIFGITIGIRRQGEKNRLTKKFSFKRA